MKQPIIALEEVSVSRQGHLLLDSIAWHTETAQHWALLGANGAGKTTLLQTVLGYLWPTSGRVRVLGHTLGEYDVRELRKQIGFVSVNMDARLEAGAEAIAIVATGKWAAYDLYEPASEKDYARAKDLLQQVGAQALLHQPYQTLSQGERQKVMIARALMPNPRILILDEPCVGLDFPSREQLLIALQQIAAQPDCPQLIYVTHYPEEIFAAISHVLLLRAGRMVAQGEKRATLTAEMLSQTFSAAVNVSWHDDSPIVRVAGR